MRIAILQCDTVMEKFEKEFGQYCDMIKNMFVASEGKLTFEFEIFDCQQGNFPTDINRFDFFITTGSKASVYDNETWIKHTIEFIRLLDEQKKKLIGLCFGHQLIAMARNSAVAKSAKGWGVGVSTNRVVSKPSWMSQSTQELKIIVSHQDQITNLPDDATVIAESDFCPYFVVQWGDNFLSVQGHPEWITDYSGTLINDRRDRIPAEQVDAGLASLKKKPDNSLFAHWILDFVQYA
jgi:GMP synthase-like glutamine amidotransferase